MALLLAEGIVDEVIAWLRSDLPARVEAVNVARDDAITLATPPDAAYYPYELRDRTMAGTIGVVVLVADSEIEGWDADEADAVHSLIAGVVLREADPERLRRSLYRYCAAIWQSLVDGWAADSVTYEIALERRPTLTFGQLVVPGAGATYLSDCAVNMLVRKVEAE